MADARSLTVRDAAGAPVTTGVTIQLYIDMTTGAARTAPAMNHRGDGKWVFVPTDADEAAGVLVVVLTGGNHPRRASFAVHKPDNSNQFFVFHFENGAGDLWLGAAVGAPQYIDPSGAARTPPTLAKPADPFLGVVGIYTLTPTPADIAAGVEGRLDAPAGASPDYWEFSSEPIVAVSDATNPVVANVTPPSGTEITRETPIGFEITDAGGNLEHTNVCVYYPSLQRFEVLFYAAISGAWGSRPEGFGPQYTGTRTPIANGFAFTNVIRRNGWPARPVVVIDPTDDAGNEAA